MLRAAALFMLVVICTSTVTSRVRAGDAAAAEALFIEGQLLFEAGKIDEACAKLEASLVQEHAAGTLINLARCHIAQGRIATAWAEYREVTELARKNGQTERAKGAATAAKELESKLSYLTIDTAAPAAHDLEVTRDGIVVTSGALGVAVPVDPGLHRIEAKAPGHAPWSMDVQVEPRGHRASVTVPALETLPAPPSAVAPAPLPPGADDEGGFNGIGIAGFVVGGAGVASVIVAAVLGAVTLSDMSKVETDESLCGADKLCSPEGRDVVDGAETKGIASTVLFGVGGALVATGIALVVIGRDEGADNVSVRLVPIAVEVGPGLTIEGTF